MSLFLAAGAAPPSRPSSESCLGIRPPTPTPTPNLHLTNQIDFLKHLTTFDLIERDDMYDVTGTQAEHTGTLVLQIITSDSWLGVTLLCPVFLSYL